MKICLIRDYKSPACDSQGAERVVESLTTSLLDCGHEVVMKLLPGSTNAPAPLVDSIPKDCDILNFHQWEENDNPESYGIPWVLTIHGGGMETDPQWIEKMDNNPHIICVSKFVADKLNNKAYAWTCSDPNNFTFQKEKENYFLWMAGTDWGESKGLWSTIAMAKKLKFNLVIAGTGQNKNYIDLINQHCDDKIKYVGVVNGKEKASLLAGARALILLTKVADACPTTVGEAMLSGTPVIGSDMGSLPELLNENVGFICKSESDVVKAILSVNNIDPNDCYNYGIKNFSNSIIAKRYLQFYENMLNFGTVSP